jgi:hypothetical protein
MKQIALSVAALVVLAWTGGTAVAQGVADPTRPPPRLNAPQPGSTGGAPVAEPEERPAPTATIVVAGPSRQFAIVDGHLVRVGETYNGSRLKAVSIRGAVWEKEPLRRGGSAVVATTPDAMSGPRKTPPTR